ncbi:MAG: type IV pilin-like G/H family protein [Prochloraceae cyanobacterium]|nr:type IV pilin-like G/H family protein [Prochloraceae cyanobacterium]
MLEKFSLYLLSKKKKSSQKGFTLIELLVVVIIVGILAAVALPNLIQQIGKSRETEAKNNLGVLSRAQETYHFETQKFASTQQALNGYITLEDTKYYSFPDPTLSTSGSLNIVKQNAIPLNPEKDRTRNYSAATYFDSGIYYIVICQAKDVNATVEAPNNYNDPCTNDGLTIK